MFNRTINFLILSILIILSACVNAPGNNNSKKIFEHPLIAHLFVINYVLLPEGTLTKKIHDLYYKNVQLFIEKQNKYAGKNEPNPYTKPLYTQNYKKIHEKETLCARTLIDIRKSILESKKASFLAKDVVKDKELEELQKIAKQIVDDKTLNTPNYFNCQMVLIIQSGEMVDLVLELAATRTSMIYNSLEDIKAKKYKLEPLNLIDIDKELADIPEARRRLLKLFDPYAYQ